MNNTLFPFMTTQRTHKVVKIFIKEAKTMIGLGDKEIRRGDVVGSLIESEETKSFLSIAIRHYGEGVKKLRIAYELLRQAKKLNLSQKYKVYVELCEKECREKANYALIQKKDLEFLLEKRKSESFQFTGEFTEKTQTNSDLI